MKVLVLKKNNKEIGRVSPDRRSLLIGRSPVCDLVIRKIEHIKPLHFLMEWTGEGSFDPYSGFWTIIDISGSESEEVNKDYHGEAHVLIESEIEIGEFQFSFVEEKLAKTALAKGVISRSLEYDNNGATFVRNDAESVLELVTYSRSNDLVTSINHFSKDVLARGIKINSLANLEFTYNSSRPNILSFENLGEKNLVDIYNRSERLIDYFSKENSVCHIDIEDFYLLSSIENAYYLRWVPKVQVSPPPRAWKKDPVILTLIFVIFSMFLFGLLMQSIKRPVTMDIPIPKRVATVQILDLQPVLKEEPPLPVIDKEVNPETVQPPPVEPPKDQVKVDSEKDKPKMDKPQTKPKNEDSDPAKKTPPKIQGARATIKNLSKNDEPSQGLNQKAPIKNVNSVGLLGKLSGGKKTGSGVDAKLLVSSVTPTDAAVGSEGRVKLKGSPSGNVNLTSGKTEASTDEGAGLSAAATTLKMDNLSKGTNISGMVSSKATGGIGSGVFGGNKKEGSGSIESLGGSVSIEVKSMEIQGGLTKEQVRQAISDNRRALRNCHEQYLTYKKDLGGRLVLRWKVNGEGPVDTASIQSSDTKYGIFDSCVLEVIKKIVFPKAASGNSTVVIYPFVFQPKK